MRRYLTGEALFVGLLALAALVAGAAVGSTFLVALGVLVLACSVALGWVATHGGI